MYPGQLEIVSLPVGGPGLAGVTSASLPPPTVSPPQADSPIAITSAVIANAIAAGFLGSGLLCMAPHLVFLSGSGRLFFACGAARLADHVHVLRLPAQRHPDPSAGQR